MRMVTKIRTEYKRKPAERHAGIYVRTEKSTSHPISRAGCASYILCGRDDVGIVPYIFGGGNAYSFSASSTATATLTVAPTMGLLPMPRKPIISTSNPPDGGFVPAAQGLLEKESRPFAKQEAHHLKAVCCAFLSWEYLITSTVHETRCFDLIIQLLSSLFHLYHLLTSFNHPPPRVSENKS